ncbi:MAG: DUF5320 domain-containing protein [Candidatus Saliniplasma sp.]
MPWGDGTGPAGYGPMTGRGLGYCAGYSSPGYTKGLPMGRGRGFGRGRGWWGRGYHPTYRPPLYDRRAYYPAVYSREYIPEYSEEDEVKYLKDYAESLKKELEEIESRIEELTTE